MTDSDSNPMNMLTKREMEPMVAGVIDRLRQTHAQGLLRDASYQTYMETICDIRTAFAGHSAERVQERLRSITANCGAGCLSDILRLHLGIVYDARIDLGAEELAFYDSHFTPLFYVVRKDSAATDDVVVDGTPDQLAILSNPSALYQISGGCVVVPTADRSFMVFGVYAHDTAAYYTSTYAHLRARHADVLDVLRKKVDVAFATEYMDSMTLRDVESMTSLGIATQIQSAYTMAKQWVSGPPSDLVAQFEMGTAATRRDIVTLMFMRNIHVDQLPHMRSLCTPDDFRAICTSLAISQQKKLQDAAPDTSTFASAGQLLEQIFGLPPPTHAPPPPSTCQGAGNGNCKRKRPPEPTLRERVEASGAPPEAMAKALQRVSAVENSRDGDAKSEKYVEGFLKLPFGVYREDAVRKKRETLTKRARRLGLKLGMLQRRTAATADDTDDVLGDDGTRDLTHREVLSIANEAIATQRFIRTGRGILRLATALQATKRDLLREVRPTLDRAVHGHDKAKMKFEQIVAQWMNGQNTGAVIGIQGPPGNGKTSLVKEGLARCLRDADGSPRPFCFIPLGGLRDGAGLVGHSFTYVGSTWGKVADNLMQARCMNPIIYFDEVDKISAERGQEIAGILTSLTDSTQNATWFEEYFSNIPLDLSKALFVFTFNNVHRIDPILRDRMSIIQTKALRMPEKLVICRDYLLPRIRREVGLGPQDLVLDDAVVQRLVEDYTMEAGVRRIKELLYDLAREANRRGIVGDLEAPYHVDDALAQDMLAHRDPLIHDTVHAEPLVGTMNGLYANSSGLGGITKIEAVRRHSKTHLDLTLTGNQGDIMKESMRCAMSVAYNLLDDAERKALVDQDTFGIHIHCPSGATPKDGPSAGGAITLALLSLLRRLPLPHTCAMTGETDTSGNITQIGGLDEKLLGAKKAGVRRVFIPEQNRRDWDRIVADGLLTEDDSFEVICVAHIRDVLHRIWPVDAPKTRGTA